MTPEQLVAVAAVVLSVLFAYTPKLKEWYDHQSKIVQRDIMAACLAAVVVAVVAASCYGVAIPGVGLLTCDKAGMVDAVWLFILAVAANQGTYMLLPASHKER
jgi:hypothetical protein